MTVALFASGGLFAGPSKEQYNSIIELAAEGKLEAAKAKLNTYLEYHPNDAYLKSMAKQLEAKAKQLEGMATEAPAEPEPKKTNHDPKVTAILNAVRKVDMITDAATGVDAARNALDKYAPAWHEFEKKYVGKEWLPFWASVVQLVRIEGFKDVSLGWAAGQRLMADGGFDSSDLYVKSALKLLGERGWLEDRNAVLDRELIQDQVEAAINILEITDAKRRAAQAKAHLKNVGEFPQRAFFDKPRWIPYWTARAALALEANLIRDGVQAAERLLALSADNSSEAIVQTTINDLRQKEWWGVSVQEALKNAAANSSTSRNINTPAPKKEEIKLGLLPDEPPLP